MKKVNKDGQNGFYDESSGSFFPVDSMQKVNYQGSNGYYSDTTGFVPDKEQSSIPSPEEQVQLTHKGTTVETAVEPWKRTVSDIARPILEAGGAVGGGTLGAAAGVGIGSIPGGAAGGALGYAGGKAAADVLDQFLGLSRGPQTVKDALGQTATNIGEGMALESLGPMAALLKARVAGTGRKIAESLYERALKPSTVNLPAKNAAVVRTALEENIPLAERGLEKGWGIVKDIGEQVKTPLAAATSEGFGMPANIVMKPLEDYAAKVAKNSPLAGAEKPVQDIIASFVAKHMRPQVAPGMKLLAGQGGSSTGDLIDINPSQAWDYVQTLNKELNPYYKQLGKGEITANAGMEAKKVLRDTLSDAVKTSFPELAPLLKRQSNVIELNKQLSRAVNRIGNRDLFGLITTLGGIGGATMGNPVLGLVAAGIVASPTVQSTVARWLYKAGAKGTISEVNKYAYKAMAMSLVGQRNTEKAKEPIPIPDGQQFDYNGTPVTIRNKDGRVYIELPDGSLKEVVD